MFSTLGRESFAPDYGERQAPQHVRLLANTEEEGLLPNGAMPRHLPKGWQSRCENLMDRMNNLFNSYAMADVIFFRGDRHIPAHRFILGSASPVFYASLMQPADDMAVVGQARMWRIPRMPLSGPPECSPACPLRIELDNIQFDALFEFLRFLYTNDVVINVSNVSALAFLADDFKVPVLAELCCRYVKKEVSADNVLRMMSILKHFLLKATVAFWQDVVEKRKMLKRFSEMALADRKRRLQTVDRSVTSYAGSHRTSVASSRKNSFSSSVDADVSGALSCALRLSVLQNRHAESDTSSQGEGTLSRAGSRSSVGMKSFVSGAPSTFHQRGSEYDEAGISRQTDLYRLLDGDQSCFRKYKFLAKAMPMYSRMAFMHTDVMLQCWRIIHEETHAVFSGEDLLHQSPDMVKALMSLEMSSVPEIIFFRALMRWTDHRCREKGLPCLPETRRQVIGDQLLELVRFPLITLQQLQWEVVPTGVLTHLEVKNLHAVASGQAAVWLLRFNPEPRTMALADLVEMRVHRHAKEVMALKQQVQEHSDGALVQEPLPDHRPLYVSSPSFEETRLMRAVAIGASASYVAQKDDEMDGILGYKLWQDHIRRVLAEQEQLTYALEKGVPMHKDGSVALHFNDKDTRSPAHRRVSRLVSKISSGRGSVASVKSERDAGPSRRAPTRQELEAEEPKRPLRKVAPETALEQAREEAHEGACSGLVTGETRNDGSAEDAIRRAEEHAVETMTIMRRNNLTMDRSPMMLGEYTLAQPRDDAASSRITSPHAPSTRGPSPRLERPESRDFVRVEKGLYMFREERWLEMKFEEGKPLVFDRGGAESCEDWFFEPDSPFSPDSNISDQHDVFGDGAGEPSQSPHPMQPPTGPGVPLEEFISSGFPTSVM